MKRTLLAIAILCAIPATAHAEPETRQVAVAYADLDLASAADQARLTWRIHDAMAGVCGERPHWRFTEKTADHKACIASLQMRPAAPAQVRASFDIARRWFD